MSGSSRQDSPPGRTEAPEATVPEDSVSWRLTAVLRDEVYQEIELAPMICAEIADKKQTSKIVRELNGLHPLSEFLHLKRVKSLGKGENLQVLVSTVISPDGAEEDIQTEQSLLQSRSIEGLGRLSIVQVPKFKPITRKQYEAAVKYWPTHFHEDKRLEKALNGELLSQQELDRVRRHMEAAMQEASSAHEPGRHSVGAVVVDPATNMIIARGHSESHCHPLKHAVMVCIDRVAEGQGGGAWNHDRASRLRLAGDGTETDVSRQTTVCSGDDGSPVMPEATTPMRKRKLERDRQYLCTGYDLYTSREPCVMCAMALVHTRIRRVFYSCAEPHTGGLGSQFRIHTQQGLNHHFEVFRGVLEHHCKVVYPSIS